MNGKYRRIHELFNLFFYRYYVPISDVLYNTLKKIPANPEGHIFKDCSGAFKTALTKAGIILPKSQLTHVLRHTFASHFMMNDGNILVLKEILGHASITTTMTYAHLSPSYLQQAVKLNPLSFGCHLTQKQTKLREMIQVITLKSITWLWCQRRTHNIVISI